MTPSPPWLERVISERAEVSSRLEKLQLFLTLPHPLAANLDQLDLAFLRLQSNVMQQYVAILDLRITKAQS